MAEPVRIATRLLADGTYASAVVAGGRVCDLAAAWTSIGGRPYDRRRESPLDALLQSGRARAALASLVAMASTDPTPPLATIAAPPVVRPGKILALGRTYREHAAELGNPVLAEPLIFGKLADGLVGDRAEVSVPGRAQGRMEHEAELALIVGQPAWALPNGNGRDCIFGIAIANDLTLRTVQKAAQKAGHPWLAAKNFPGSCALGPWMTVLSPETDLDGLQITCSVNGAVRQSASTSTLMRPVAGLVEWISHVFPLHPGDVILTGTPAGTGPLHAGDVCEISIKGGSVDLGTLITTVR